MRKMNNMKISKTNFQTLKPLKTKSFRGTENIKYFLVNLFRFLVCSKTNVFDIFSSKHKLNKKGYFFLMDAIFAMVILMIGFMIITSTKPNNVDEIPLDQVSENLVDILSTVKINELCDNNCECSEPLIETFCPTIKNKDQAILDYLGELYDSDELQSNQNAMRVFKSVIDGLYRKDLYGIELIIDNTQLYIDGDKEGSGNLITAKRVLFGYYENTLNGDVEFWGPYLLEINVWEK